MNSLAETTRLNYLDTVRAFALLLGIVFHASISFMPIYIGWAVMDVSTSPVVPLFMLVSHSFRMPLFFLIAGFFGHMTFHGKGGRAFLESRLVRIVVPFVAGWFLLRPLLVSAWIIGGESMRGDADVARALRAGFATLGELPKDLFVGTHLWFLYYLLLVTAGTLAFRWLVGLHVPTRQRLSKLADAVTGWVANSRSASLVIAMPTAGCLWFMSHWGMDTPDKSLVPHVPVTFIYGGFFLFGWILHRQAVLIERFASLSWGKALLCVLAIVVSVRLSRFEMNAGHEQYLALKAAYAFSYAITMWTLVSLSIGLFKHFFDRPSKTVRYIADSSYWLYLIHLPIVIALQIVVAELPGHWSIKLAAVTIVTLLVSILLYDLFVRATFIGAILNGKRKPRVLFRYRAPGNTKGASALEEAG